MLKRLLSILKAVSSRLFIVILSLAFTVILIEVFMRVGFEYLPPRIQGEIQNVRRVPWDDRPILLPMPFESDRGYLSFIKPGYVNYPIQWMDAHFKFSTITLWDHPVGLRTSASPRWPIDIVTAGDSFTFCWTNIEDCWAQKLESDYGWSVINIGQPGTGPMGQLRLIKEVGLPVKPRLVIWQRFANDSFDDYVLNYIRGDAPLPLTSPPAHDPPTALKGLEHYSALLRVFNSLTNPPPKSNDYHHDQTVKVNGRWMIIVTDEFTHGSNTQYQTTQFGWKNNIDSYYEGVKTVNRELNAPVVFVVIPNKEEAYADYLGEYLSEAFMDELGQNRRLMLAQCEEHGWQCIDMLPYFKEAVAAGETVYYARDFHLDASGNAIIARVVEAYIEEHHLLDDAS